MLCRFISLRLFITACDGGMYGEGCAIPCGNCLESRQCHHINGTCMNGCDNGYSGSNCTDGWLIIWTKHYFFFSSFFLLKCTSRISSFLKECEDNFFGQNCRERCNETCRSCNKTTGVCDNGCYPGWRGQYCQQGKTFSLIMLKVPSTVTSRWKLFHVICPVNCGFSRQFRYFVKFPILTRGNLWFNHFVNVGFYDELKILPIFRKRFDFWFEI